MPATDSDSASSLARHVDALYPLARVLAGSDEAEALIEDVYERASQFPPSQRPSDERGWLFRLMLKERGGPLQSAGAEVHPESETSFTNDPFRREVAAQTAERMLPVAFAACSIHERLILAIDVLADPSDEALAVALDTSSTNARSIRDRARSALRAGLRDVLTGPERMLVDVALPDEALRKHLHNLLSERFQPAPSSLRATVTDVLESARAERQDDGTARSPTDEESTILTYARSLLEGFLSTRGLLAVLVILGVTAAGIGGFSYFSTTTPASPQDVIDLSVEERSDLQMTHPAESPSVAGAYIQQMWNRSISAPTIDGATLEGVGELSFANRTVPALIYADDETGDQIVVYAYNYAILDELSGRATLDRDLRSKLAANDSLLPKEHSGKAVVIWRQRDDIFILVAPESDPTSLRSRIRL